MQKGVMLSNVVDMVSGVVSRMICESLKNWRFYFDDADREKIKKSVKDIMLGFVNDRRL